eukprot:CAMPEP_0197024226 /NCGR_PEP_ID=MMETSP1384-20130603/4826_1 /TAXON_ID=29189 /ORGANISM="Ammonia sp." /LENGTH=532 /DNA_ID=CAMNT_0042452575 /DNA_START=42 /DNA_END=1640 /DNA_ORIENTATION=-
MAANPQDDRIITALRQTLQHISIQQKKFKNVDVELQQTKEELQKTKEAHADECAQWNTQMEGLRNELHDFKCFYAENATKMSEMNVHSAKQAQQITELTHQLNEKTILLEEAKIQNESNAITLVQQLENDNLALKTQLSKSENENNTLQQKVAQMEEEQSANNEEKIAMLHRENEALTQQVGDLQRSANDASIKCQTYGVRMSGMSECSFNMLESCRKLRRNITDTASILAQSQNQWQSEMQRMAQQIQFRSQTAGNDGLKSVECVKTNLAKIHETKSLLNRLRSEIEAELANFDKDIKSAQRVIFKQKSVIRNQMKQERDKAAKLEQTLCYQMENEQNMEQQLKDYLKQKDELQSKISKLEGFLKEKNEKDLITEMKRFRSAAIVTSVTALSENGDSEISYHQLSEHERKAISLKSRFATQMNVEVNVQEKVDEFIRSGGLRRWPILEQEFVYDPSEEDANRFRFGSRYISLFFNSKHAELYVTNDGSEKGEVLLPQLLQDWIQKNGSMEMRKLLAKVAQKKKSNKQIANY